MILLGKPNTRFVLNLFHLVWSQLSFPRLSIATIPLLPPSPKPEIFRLSVYLSLIFNNMLFR